MKKFFKWISGQTAREKAWRSLPRQLPDDMPFAPDDFVVSRELYCLDNPYIRQYAAAVYDAEKNHWKPYTYGVRGEDALECIEGCYMHDSVYYGHNLETPADVVSFLRSWEKYDHYIVKKNGNSIHFGRRKWKEIEGTDESHSAFAQRRGVHFTHSGVPYMPCKEDVVTNSVLLKGKTLTNVFSMSSYGASKPPNTWARLQEMLPVTLPDVALLAEDDNGEEFASSASVFLEALRSIATSTAPGYPLQRVMEAYNNLMEYDYGPAEMRWTEQAEPGTGVCNDFDDEAVATSLRHIVSVTTVFGLLDAAACLYARGMKDGFGKAQANIDDIQSIVSKAGNIAQKDLNITADQAGAMKDVVLCGRCPEKVFPLEEMLARYKAAVDAKRVSSPGYKRKL